MKTETLLLVAILGLGFWYVTKTATAGGGGAGGTTVNYGAPKTQERGLFETIGDLADRAWDAAFGGDDDD